MADYVNKVVLENGEVPIDISGDTVTEADVAAGATFHDHTGRPCTGTSTKDVDSSGATANRGDVLAGKTAGVRGALIEGTMPNIGAQNIELSSINDEVPISNGFHDGSGKAKISPVEKAKLADASNIKAGVTIMGTTGTYGGESVTAEAKEVNPTFSEQVVLPTDADYLSQVTVKAIKVTRTPTAGGGITVTIG